MKIKRNRICCLKCGDIIESKHTHDFVQCTCRACFVDGGKSYARYGGKPEDYERLLEYEPETPEEMLTLTQRILLQIIDEDLSSISILAGSRIFEMTRDRAEDSLYAMQRFWQMMADDEYREATRED